jgi:beta-galactosidase/beta-glucuronidase
LSGKIEISVGDVNDVEAWVYARFDETSAREGIEPVRLKGTLRGPYCETARTLPAEIKFRSEAGTGTAAAEVCVPDPCVWSEEVPHMYQVDLEARQGDQVVAEYHGRIGLRRSPNAPPRSASWPNL